MKVVSLFDGISCGMVALERVGIKIDEYISYEIEPLAIEISKKNYSGIIRKGSVLHASFTDYKGYDLLIGGSPCQSLSICQSKTRQHLDGKSKLFFEFVRAKKEINPKWFLFENVESMNEESKNKISELLGCKPVMIDSADFSAQERKRLYWTNIPVLPIKEKSKLVMKDILENADEKYFYKCDFDYLGEDKKVCATLKMKNHDIHLRVYNPRYKAPTITCCNGGHHQKKVFINGRCRKLTPLEYERLQTLPDGYTAGFSDTARYNALGNGWTVDVIAHILKCLKN